MSQNMRYYLKVPANFIPIQILFSLDNHVLDFVSRAIVLS